MRLGRYQPHLVVAVAFAVLCLPWAVAALGVRPTTVENRPLRPVPELSRDALADASFFSDLDRSLLDHTPWRQNLAEGWTRAQLALTDQSPSEDVFVGTDGTLFLSEDFLNACEHDYEVADVTDRVAEWNRVARSAGKTLTLTIAPDKASIRPDLFSLRAGLARDCSERVRSDWEAGMAAPTGFLPMWSTLRSAQDTADESLYYFFDSHWNYRGAEVFARTLVDSLLPGSWDASSVVEGEAREVRADIARRLGWLEVEVQPTLLTERNAVTTDSSIVDVAGTRPVRIYTSSSTSAPLIAGSTVVLHDSMMNFSEQLVAPYFEHVTFIHWNDVDSAGFFDIVASSDHVILEVVERSSHVRATRFFADPVVNEAMLSAVSQTSR